GWVDYVRRVGDDQVEALLLPRRERVALAKLDRVDAVQRGVERRVAECAAIDVCRNHPVDVLGGKQRLDSAAGSEVERVAAAVADGELGERHRGRLNPG